MVYLYIYTDDRLDNRYINMNIDTVKVEYDRSNVDLNPQVLKIEWRPLNSGVNFGLTWDENS